METWIFNEINILQLKFNYKFNLYKKIKSEFRKNYKVENLTYISLNIVQWVFIKELRTIQRITFRSLKSEKRASKNLLKQEIHVKSFSVF